MAGCIVTKEVNCVRYHRTKLPSHLWQNHMIRPIVWAEICHSYLGSDWKLVSDAHMDLRGVGIARCNQAQTSRLTQQKACFSAWGCIDFCLFSCAHQGWFWPFHKRISIYDVKRLDTRWLSNMHPSDVSIFSHTYSLSTCSVHQNDTKWSLLIARTASAWIQLRPTSIFRVPFFQLSALWRRISVEWLLWPWLVLVCSEKVLLVYVVN